MAFSGGNVADSFLIALQAVVKLLMIAFAGVLLEKAGYMEAKLRGGVAKIIYYCLLPCLLFTSIAANTDIDLLRRVWLLPVFGMFIPCIGVSICGATIVRIMPKSENFGWRQGVACMGLGNSGYLPLIFVPAVLQMNPFGAAPGPGEAESELRGRLAALGLSYVSCFLIGYVPFFWHFGRRFLIRPYAGAPAAANDNDSIDAAAGGSGARPSSDQPARWGEGKAGTAAAADGEAEEEGPLVDGSSAPRADALGAGAGEGGGGGGGGGAPAPRRRLSLEELARGEAALRRAAGAPPVLDRAPTALRLLRGQRGPLSSFRSLRRIKMNGGIETAGSCCQLGEKAWRFVTGHVTEVTAVASALFGLATPLKRGFFSAAGGGGLAPLEPTVTNAMRSLGAAVSPVVTILLGANVIAARRKGVTVKQQRLSTTVQSQGDDEKNVLENGRPNKTVGRILSKQTILCCLFGKLVLLPLVGTCIFYALSLTGVIPDDKVMIFVILVQFSPPTAQNVTLMCELVNHGQKEISTVLFYMYLASAITMTGWTTFFIIFINSVLVPS